MAHMATRRFTPCFRWTWRTALPRGSPPRSLISMFSSVPRPAPPPQQNVFSRVVVSGISRRGRRRLPVRVAMCAGAPPPQVAALAPHDPLDAEPLGLGVDLGVEPFDHLVRGEQAEVPALGGVGAPRVVEADLVET